MTTPLLAGHPFGTTVTEETLRNTFLPLNQWEDKYRQLILLGKQLPALPDALKAQAKEITGCENRVWLGYTLQDNGTLHFWRQRRTYRARSAGGFTHRRRGQNRRRVTDAFANGVL